MFASAIQLVVVVAGADWSIIDHGAVLVTSFILTSHRWRFLRKKIMYNGLVVTQLHWKLIHYEFLANILIFTILISFYYLGTRLELCLINF